jgi:Tfp pilus assembly protein PilF
MAGTPPQTTPHRARRSAGHWVGLSRPVALFGFAALWPLGDAHAARTCAEWSAEAVSVEGRIEIRRSNSTEWVELAAGEQVCTGDVLQSRTASRATLMLPDGNTFRLDEHTTVNFPEPPTGLGSLLELLRGMIHVISRDPRSLTFRTPYANAGLEGTEFDLRVDDGERLTEVVVLEGTVAVSTPMGAVRAASDQVAIARDGQAPTATTIDRPIDRMRWAGHYPALIDGPLPDADQEPASTQQADPRFFAARAAARLTTARLEAAEADIARALQLAPGDATALSLQALIALARADRETAGARATEAQASDPASVVARLAASYVEQSRNDLAAAEDIVREATALEPGNAVALTRLAELELARDDAGAAIATATRARALAPNRSDPLVVLGFASLRAFDTAAAEAAFAAAVDLEPDSPLARIGLALALLRRGAEQDGRKQLEIAVALDPTNPLTRSYVATVYGAENRAELSERQLDLAREFDPFDPTGWLYSALHELRSNRPVAALQDYRTATRVNDDEPVFRSRLALDDDLATRSAGLARVQSSLGFRQLALVDAWRALATDPADFTAHRLLADAYSNEPRHEIARVSELLSSQLLQPANLTPLRPQLGQTNLALAQRAGPSPMSFDELDAPVVANGLRLRASGATGSRGTEGHDVSLAGLNDRVSYSAGHYRFATDGFRANNDYDQQVANAFVQYRPSYETSLQAELRSSRTEHGDLTAFFNRELYSPLIRFDEEADSVRLGAKHRVSPKHTLLGSIVYEDVVGGIAAASFLSIETTVRGYNVDAQHIYDSGTLRIQSGALAAHRALDQIETYGPPLDTTVETGGQNHRQQALYSYAHFNPVRSLTLTAGASLDRIGASSYDEEAANPKLGLMWRPTPHTTVRAAAFKTLYDNLTTSSQNAQPRLEPVQIAGFTQLLLGGTADRATVRGVAIEQELAPQLFVGWEASTRSTERTVETQLGPSSMQHLELAERVQKGYVYWLPSDRISIAGRYEHGRYASEPVPLFGYSRMTMTRVPVELRYFARSGFTFGGRASYVDQSGEFQTEVLQSSDSPPTLQYGEDRFWVLDAFVGYRLANRRGLLSLNADNVLDESFQFQDIDPTNPSLFPERLVSVRFTLAF